MIKELIIHSFKGLKRSKEFGKKTTGNIVMGIFLFLMGVNILSIGLFLNLLIRERISPDQNPVSVFNGLLIFYFGIELIIRIVFQKYHSLAVKPYLVLNVSRSGIARLLLTKTLFTVLNLFPLLLLIPFAVIEIFPAYPAASSLAWLLAIISIMLFNCYLSNYLRARFLKNPVITAVAGLALLGLAAVQYFGIYSASAISSFMFDKLIRDPLFLLIPLSGLAVIYNMNYGYFVNNLYTEEIGKKSKDKKISGRYSLLDRLGEAGVIAALELKLLVRNKRARVTLWMPFLFVFYGMFFYPQARSENGIIFVFLGTFITGLFVLSYSNLTFSYASGHFGFLMTNNLKMHTYIKAKFLLMYGISLLIYLISLFYYIYGFNIVLINGAMLLFNIGVTSFIMLIIAGFTKNKFDMTQGIYSQQGRNSQQFFSAFIALTLQAAIFLPVKYIVNDNAGIIVLGSLGFLGVLFVDKLINVYLKFFFTRKYIMVQGFRED